MKKKSGKHHSQEVKKERKRVKKINESRKKNGKPLLPTTTSRSK